MKILQIHNQYTKPGGEDVVVDNEAKLLKQNGHSVFSFFVTNNIIATDTLLNKVKAGLNTIWSVSMYKKLDLYLNNTRPDIAHVHNTFPLLSPAIYWCLKKHAIPIVQTLHNYRFVCANGLLMQNLQNVPCEKCIKFGIFRALENKCYRKSLMATFPVVCMQAIHRIIGTYDKKIDSYIVLTNFMKELFKDAPLNITNKIYVKPNFVYSKNSYNNKKEKSFVFIGRTSHEKGLDLLLEAWSLLKLVDYRLIIVGDGPDKKDFMDRYNKLKNIEWKGYLPNDEVANILTSASCLIMPSKGYETFGMVLIESFAAGTPVVAPNHAGFPEIVEDGNNGYLFEPDSIESLINCMKYFCTLNDGERVEMGLSARRAYEKHYNPNKNYKQLLKIYESTIERYESKLLG